MQDTAQMVLDFFGQLAAYPAAPFIALPVFIVGALLAVPLSILIAVCALTFQPVMAFALSLAGTVAATVASHAIGLRFSKPVGARLSPAVVSRIERISASADTWSMIAVRLVPVAPFSIVNAAIGVVGVPLRPLLIATVVVVTPVILLFGLSVDRARAAVRGEPMFEPWIAGLILATAVTIVVMQVLVRRRNRQKAARSDHSG